MKKLINKLLLLFIAGILLGACSSEDTPSDGIPNGSSGTKVQDSNGQNLGFLISGGSTMVSLISPKGYYYNLDYEGNINHSAWIFTDSFARINRSNLYVFNSPSIGLTKKSAYFISSNSGGIPTGELFCHEDSKSNQLNSSYYIWTPTNTTQGGDFGSPRVVSAGLDTGIQITNCSYDQTGIPQNIHPPIKITG